MIQTLQALHDALAVYDVQQRVYIDLETTSFNDEEEAFRPYHGHRSTLMIIGQVGKPVVAVPLRHRTEGKKCIEDLDTALKILAEWCATLTCVANANFKFDMHFNYVDNILYPNAKIEDTLVLARLVYNEHMSYSLASLCDHYKVTAKKGEEVKEYLKQNPSKDYGTIPFDILTPYGIADVVANMDLHETLLKLLPEESVPAWNIEVALTPWLFRAEQRGIPIDTKFLMRRKIDLLQHLIVDAKKIADLSGIANPSSSAQIGAYFNGVGILSNKTTKPTPKQPKGGPSWDKDVLEWIGSLGQETPNKVADLLAKFGTDELAESTFCTGWLKHVDPNGRIHGNTKQTGTVSGRSSSEKPNLQNPPKWIYEAILIDKGRVGVAWDLSQIEYRLFAHYANDPDIIQKYKDNPEIDYHQILADKLGIPRNPTKRINFGILYGMGKGKTTTNIRREVLAFEADENNTPEMKMALRVHLYEAYYDPLVEVPPLSQNLEQKVLVTIAENILIEYHNMAPQIKQMQRMIKDLLTTRGYVKSYYGMRAYLEVQRAYVGLNRVIQGSAAYLFKKKMVELLQACKDRGLDVELDLQIHDAVYADMPLEQANDYIALAYKIVRDCPFRVPVLMDFELALHNWKNRIKIKHNTDVLSEIGKLCYFKS
jgi:DNA polymerase I